MVKIKRESKIIAIVSFFLFLIACDSSTIFDEYKSMSSNLFEADVPVVFSFEIKDSIQNKNAFINIRNNKDFAYSNLYLITELKMPSGKLEIDTLQYRMADVNGKFLGDGLSDIKENKLCYTEDCKPKQFSEAGIYEISIRQAMRKVGEVNEIKNLEGITDVGFRIEKIE